MLVSDLTANAPNPPRTAAEFSAIWDQTNTAAVVEGAKVKATIVEQDREKKIVVFKMKRRKGYRRKQGHRQYYTGVKVEAIEA